MSYWLAQMENDLNPVITIGFWKKLVSRLTDCVGELNSMRGSEVLSVVESKGYSVDVIFADYKLAIIFDIRTGLLSYWFVTPKLAALQPHDLGITAKGTVQLDRKSSFFRVTSSPAVELGGTMQDRNWPVDERLAQYLLQKLISPDNEDNRFIPVGGASR